MRKYDSIKNITDALIWFFLLATFFCVPLFFSFFIKTNNVFTLPKAALFKEFVLVLFLLSLIKFSLWGFENLGALWQKLKKERLMIFVFIFYLATLLISTFFSRFFDLSFTGSYERQLGFQTQFYFFIFFLLLLINIRGKKDLLKIFTTIVLSGLFASVYGIMQSRGSDIFYWSESTSLRATSTFGQPNLFGAFLVLVIPVNIYLLASSRHLLLKVFYFLVFVSNISALVLTHSLASWLALFLSLLIFLVFLAKRKEFFKKAYIFPIVIAVLLVFVSASSSHTFRNKIGSMFSFQEGSIAARLDFWQASAKLIKEKPFLGYGLETQGEYIARHYEPDWAIHSNVGVRPSKAHNIFLDKLLTRGILGLFAYIFLLYLFFKLAFSNIKAGRESFLNISILASLSSLLLFLQFNYVFIVSEFLFWTFFATILYLYLNLKETNLAKSKLIDEKYLKLLPLFLFIVIYLCFAQSKKEMDKFIADSYYYDIRELRYNNQYFKSLVVYDYIRGLDLKQKEYSILFGEMLAAWTPRIESGEGIYSYSGGRYMAGILEKIDGETYTERRVRANINAYLSREAKYYYFEAEKEYLGIINDYPGLPRTYYKLAELYFNQAQIEKSKEMVFEALERVPSPDSEYLNLDHRKKIENELFLNYSLLSEIYKKEGNETDSSLYAQKAKNLVEYRYE